MGRRGRWDSTGCCSIGTPETGKRQGTALRRTGGYFGRCEPEIRGFFPSKGSGHANPAPGHVDRDPGHARIATRTRRGLALHLYGAAVDS